MPFSLRGYKNIATEDFENTAELCAAILARGISTQIKRGLGKEYIPRAEALSSLRGKIDISDTIKTQALQRKQMVCFYDEFSVDSYMNRIIKSTMLLLLRADITKTRKKDLRKLLVFFDEVHSDNMYQIFTYVKNKELELADNPHEVSGMLLYAKTDEDIYPENEYRMRGNRIEVRTLNLDGDFDSIRSQLDGIAERYFGIRAA